MSLIVDKLNDISLSILFCPINICCAMRLSDIRFINYNRFIGENLLDEVIVVEVITCMRGYDLVISDVCVDGEVVLKLCFSHKITANDYVVVKFVINSRTYHLYTMSQIR